MCSLKSLDGFVDQPSTNLSPSHAFGLFSAAIGLNNGWMERCGRINASGDAKLLSLFQDKDGDIYKQVAATLFRTPLEHVSTEHRNLAKSSCLGLIYGMGTKELAKRWAAGMPRGCAGKGEVRVR